MTRKAKLLLIYVDENDRHGDMPAYEAIVRRLLQQEIAGATAAAGIMGFGSHHRVHHKRLLGVSDDRPVTITAIDDEDKIRNVMPQIRQITPKGIVALLDIEVLE